MKRLTRDEAFLIAVNIAKLPSVPRQILKDIPRPPNSASRDDWTGQSNESEKINDPSGNRAGTACAGLLLSHTTCQM
jgi:hypothetical protein